MKKKIKKILREDIEKQHSISYSAVVLTEGAKQTLISKIGVAVPNGWTVVADHMTIALGKRVENQEDLGKEVTLIATHFGMSNMAAAVKVTGYPSANEVPHITVALNPDGGKPQMSKEIERWVEIKPLKLKGIVTEINNK